MRQSHFDKVGSMQLTPLIAVHLTAAIIGIAIGPVALWARLGMQQRPKLHRAFGYAWVTVMLIAATSAIFIRDYRIPNIGGFTPIHILIPVTYIGILVGMWSIAKGNIKAHRRSMQRTYLGACVVAGIFTLLPSRYLGGLLFHNLLGIT